MSENDSPRRVMAEIRAGVDQTSIAQVGNRSIHHFWQLLAPDFQGILLAPQRRPDDGGVAWSWKEPAGSKPVTSSELAELRERLMAANRAFAKNLDGSDLGSESLGGLNGKDGVDQLRSKVNEVVTKLTGKPDAKFAAFVCRTDGGVRLHSWGALVAAQPFFPDARDCEVSGMVLVGEKGALDFEVVIESRTGVQLARTRSDASGHFRLQKIGPGTHRVRVISDRVDFPVSGVMVTVERTSITNLELRSTSGTVASGMLSQGNTSNSSGRLEVSMDEVAAGAKASTVQGASTRRRWWFAIFAAAAMAVAGGGWWIWNLSHTEDRSSESTTGESSFLGGRSVRQDGVNHPATRSRLVDLDQRSHVASADGTGDSQRSGSGHPASGSPASAESSTTKPPHSRSIDGDKNVDSTRHPVIHAANERTLPDAREKPDNAARSTPNASDPNDNGYQPPDVAPAGAQEKPEALSDSEKLPLANEKSAPLRKARAKASGVAPELATPDSDASTSSAEESTDGDRSQDDSASPRAKAGGAKSAKVASETAPQMNGLSGAESDDAEDSSGPSASISGPAEASRNQSVPASATKGKGRNELSAASAPTGHGAPMAAAQTPDSTNESDPRAAGPSATAPALEGGKRVPRMHPESKPTSPTTGTDSGAAEASEPESAEAERPTAPDQVPDKARATSPYQRVESPAPAAPVAPADGNTAGAAEGMDSRANGSLARAKPVPIPSQPAAKPHSVQSPTATNGPLVAEPVSSPEGTTAVTLGETGGSSPGNVAGPDVAPRFSRQVSIRVSSWRPQLVQDVILPTEPVLAGTDDAIEQLRENYLKEKRGRIPASFRNPVLLNGCALVVASGDLTSGKLLWQHSSGGGEGIGTISGDRAEIAWSGATPPPTGRDVLCRANGREIAEIVVDRGSVVVKALDGVRCWYWVAVEPAAADSVDITAGAPSRFAWQLSRGAILPDATRRDDRWRDGRMQRLDLPINLNDSAGTSTFAVAFVDRVTGWAIGGQIDEQASPVAEP